MSPCVGSSLSAGDPASPLRGVRVRLAGGRGRRAAVGRLADDLDAHRCGRCPRSVVAAASMSFALRSAILISAISRTWSRVTRPTVSRRSCRAPFSTPAALRRRSAAGGVLRMNVNERSSKTVIWAGMIWPRLVGGLLVVGLGELDDVDAVRAQRGADRRRGRRLAGGQLEGQDDADLLGHGCSGRVLSRASRLAGSRARPASRGRRC